MPIEGAMLRHGFIPLCSEQDHSTLLFSFYHNRYTDEQQCIPEDRGNTVCRLRVPGAAALVRDVVTIVINTTAGEIEIVIEIIF